MYFLSDEDPMPHRAKKDPKGCRGRKDMKHEIEITKRHTSWSVPCGWSAYGVRGGGIKRWYNCYHQKACKKCGKVVEWYLKDLQQCPDWQRANITRYLNNIDPDLDSLPIEKE